jgi:hypothetical protein
MLGHRYRLTLVYLRQQVGVDEVEERLKPPGSMSLIRTQSDTLSLIGL